MRLSDSQLTSD